MRLISMVCLLAVVMLTAFKKDPMALLRRAQANLNNHAFVSYRHTSLWPNPSDLIDTTISQCSFSAVNGKYFKYDYVMQSNAFDIVFIGQELREANHEEQKIVSFPEEQEEELKRHATENTAIRYFPLTVLNMAWSYAKDTVEQKTRMSEYRIVEMDTVIEGRKIFVGLHLFINASTALPERYERRAFMNGKSTQTIVHLYSDYKLGKKPVALAYTMPLNYKTEIFGQGKQLEVLREGEPAPSFTAVDMKGKPVSLEALRGKKVLLDFSVINCGYCKLALDHLNRSDFKLRDDIVGIYINPMDKKAKIELYAQKVNIPFTLVPEARELGKQYGVFGYPTFYLINEQGMIERVVVGYRKEFMDELSSR